MTKDWYWNSTPAFYQQIAKKDDKLTHEVAVFSAIASTASSAYYHQGRIRVYYQIVDQEKRIEELELLRA